MYENAIRYTARLAKDPEFKDLGKRGLLANLLIGLSERKKDESGQWKEVATKWVKVTVWNHECVKLCQILKKGDLVLISGAIKVESWEKDGVQRVELGITIGDAGSIQHIVSNKKMSYPKTYDTPVKTQGNEAYGKNYAYKFANTVLVDDIPF